MSEKQSAKEFLDRIKSLATGLNVAPTPAAKAALDNIEIRIAQFEENLKNPLPSYLFDGQSAVLTDLRKKRDGLIAGTISIEAAMSVEPLPEERTMIDELPTEALAVAIATMQSVKETPEAEASANAEPTTEPPDVPNVNSPQIDAKLLAAIVARVREAVVREVIAEAARLVIEAKRNALREDIIQVKTEFQNHGE
jgi:hypothetical protein